MGLQSKVKITKSTHITASPLRKRSSAERRQSFFKKPQRKKFGTPTLPTILVVGSSDRAEQICTSLEAGMFHTSRAKDEEAAISRISENTLAVVVSDGTKGQSPVDICARLNAMNSERPIPLFFVLTSRGIEAFERELYVNGCDAIFEHPRDTKDLPVLVSEFLRSNAKSSSSESLDTNLTKEVEERLQKDRDVFGKKLKVAVYEGIVSIRGRIDAYWKLRYLERALASIPNVSALLTSAVSLDIKRKSDRQLERDIRGLVSVSHELHNRTLDISVSKGHVRIRGSAADANELERLEGLVNQIEPVKSISTVVVVSDEQSRRDSSFASYLNKRLLSVFPSSDIRASVFGGVAVLRGHVSTLTQALDASKVANRMLGIRRVVNKLQVERS